MAGLQDAVLQPQAIEYAVQEFTRQLKEATGTLSHEVDRATTRRSQLEIELNRLIDAIASGAQSTFLIDAIQQKEQELKVLDERLSAARDVLPAVQPTEIVDFVTDKLTALSSLLNSDVTQARAELLRHVTEIRLIPQETSNGGRPRSGGELESSWKLSRNGSSAPPSRCTRSVGCGGLI